MLVTHTLKPIYNEQSKVLILGTMPSVVSREKNFYYAHPRNRFWALLGALYNCTIPETKEDRITFLLKHHIALFDCLKSCNITSSSDASIKNPIPNDLTDILKNSQINVIFTTGTKAYTIYQKYIYPKTKIQAILLPSPSPANAAMHFEDLLKEYAQIKNHIENN